jgi:hypothetical protein
LDQREQWLLGECKRMEQSLHRVQDRLRVEAEAAAFDAYASAAVATSAAQGASATMHSGVEAPAAVGDSATVAVAPLASPAAPEAPNNGAGGSHPVASEGTASEAGTDAGDGIPHLEGASLAAPPAETVS